MTKTCIFIDGGAGRVVAAIPALRKFAKLNPNNDFVVVIYGWDNLVWGIPELTERTYNTNTKGLFDNVIKHCDETITPEPYKLPQYFNQQKSLAQAFDYLINKTNDHQDLEQPFIIHNKAEEKTASNVIADVKQKQGKQKTIVIQPYGRSARVDRDNIIDDNTRSLSVGAYLELAKKLSKKYNLILMAEDGFKLEEDTYSFKLKTELRAWSAIIDAADYFVGVDSVGQHFARAVNTPGTVIFGSTFPVNTSYPDFFNIYEKEGVKKYCPIRISELDSHIADRINDTLMDFDEKELDAIYISIVKDIEKKCK